MKGNNGHLNEQLIAKLYPSLLRMAKKYEVGTIWKAEDLVQEALCRLVGYQIKSEKRIPPEDSRTEKRYSRFLLRVAKNFSIDRLKCLEKRTGHAPFDEDNLAPPHYSPMVDEQAAALELARKVRWIIDSFSLTPAQRESIETFLRSDGMKTGNLRRACGKLAQSEALKALWMEA